MLWHPVTSNSTRQSAPCVSTPGKAPRPDIGAQLHAFDMDELIASPWLGLHYRHEFLLHHRHELLERNAES
jgi:hypothetical protein